MERITVITRANMEFVDVTSEVQAAITRLTCFDGIALVFVPHTTAGIVINEGADPAVQEDLLQALKHITPALSYRHAEGNSPAHLQSALTGASVLLPVEKGRLCLGTWQRIFFCEFDGPRTRNLWIKTV
jgi:secondary thiamine-phosphate synthase enzyme